MKRTLRLLAIVALLALLISSCSLDSLFQRKANISITNPTDASVQVTCPFFTGSNTITIPANSTRTVEVRENRIESTVTLFPDGWYYQTYDSVLDVAFNSSGMRVTLEPDVSWIVVRNFTNSTLQSVMFNDSTTSIIGNSSFCNSSGTVLNSGTLISGQTGYLRISAAYGNCNKSGWITFDIGNFRYSTTAKVVSPPVGEEKSVYLYSTNITRR